VTLTEDDITIDFSTVQVTKQKTTPMSAEESEALLESYNIPSTLIVKRILDS